MGNNTSGTCKVGHVLDLWSWQWIYGARPDLWPSVDGGRTPDTPKEQIRPIIAVDLPETAATECVLDEWISWLTTFKDLATTVEKSAAHRDAVSTSLVHGYIHGL